MPVVSRSTAPVGRRSAESTLVMPDLPMGEVKRLLSWLPFLEALTGAELEALVGRASFERLDEGDAIVVGPEEHGERVLVVVAGQVQVYETDASGRELTLSVLEGGSWVGATGLAARRERELCVRAWEPSLLCRLERRELEGLARQRPEAGLALAQVLAERLVWMEARWADVAAKDVSARLASMLLMLVEAEGVVAPEGGYRIPTRYTHWQIASMIGANREAITRAFSELQEVGGLEVRRRFVYVTDIEALKRASK